MMLHPDRPDRSIPTTLVFRIRMVPEIPFGHPSLLSDTPISGTCLYPFYLRNSYLSSSLTFIFCPLVILSFLFLLCLHNSSSSSVYYSEAMYATSLLSCLPCRLLCLL